MPSAPKTDMPAKLSYPAKKKIARIVLHTTSSNNLRTLRPSYSAHPSIPYIQATKPTHSPKTDVETQPQSIHPSIYPPIYPIHPSIHPSVLPSQVRLPRGNQSIRSLYSDVVVARIYVNNRPLRLGKGGGGVRSTCYIYVCIWVLRWIGDGCGMMMDDDG